MNSLTLHDRRRFHIPNHTAGDSNQPLDVLLALDRMVIEVSMQLYNVNRRERSRMRRQNRRLHAAVRKHLPRLLKTPRATR